MSCKNRLAIASSPYLRQHASNPVEWYSWSAEAFEKARQEQKPIFLSIGYSTCHWCHVMAHESFEDPLIARLLNEYFVAVKVDREERPDVDRLYMNYVQSLTGSGGWPLSVWLTPEGTPFFGGTYFPPRGDRSSYEVYGRVGFDHILEQIVTLWEESRSKLEEEGKRNLRRLEVLLQGATTFEEEPSATETILRRAADQLLPSFDPAHGGFGGAPKFPQPSRLFFLSREAFRLREKDPVRSEEIEKVFLKTLDKMAAGGIYDHLGGGFHRYSVDASWKVPHFEKMLYDQAQLLMVYLEGWQMTHDPAYYHIIEGVCDYLLRDMEHPDGGFYAAEDADSWEEKEKKKIEGAFYCWKYSELYSLLSPQQLEVLGEVYQLRREGNIPSEYDPHGEMREKNILHRVVAPQEGKAASLLEEAHQVLFQARLKRPRPHRDEKIVTAWNGMIIGALAKAGALLERPEYLEGATRAATFLQKNLYRPQEKKLLRSWCEGVVIEFGFAEDYACLMVGLLDLYEATGEVLWLSWAEELGGAVEERFWQEERGGYLGSQVGADPYLLLDLQEEYDGAEPSATSMIALYLERFGSFGSFAQKQELKKRFDQIVLNRGKVLEEMPTALTQFLVALEEKELPPRQLVFVGKLSRHREKLVTFLHTGFFPQQRTFLLDVGRPEKEYEFLFQQNPALKEMWDQGKEQQEGAGLVFLCEDFVCHAPQEI